MNAGNQVTDTEAIDRLFLELSQFTKATTAREMALKVEVELLKAERLKMESKQPNQLLIEAHNALAKHEANGVSVGGDLVDRIFTYLHT